MTMDSELAGLLPCPFCGCKNIDIRTRKTTLVECKQCGSMFISARKERAIKRWNTRAIAESRK